MTAKRKQLTPAQRQGKKSKRDLAAKPELVPGEDEVRPPPISRQHMLFCTHYCSTYNGKQSVEFAKIPSAAPSEMARFLLAKPEIQANIRWIRKQLGELHFDLHNQLMAQYDAMRNADPTQMLDAEGNLKDPAEWPEGCKLLLTGIEVEEVSIGEGTGMQRVKKVKMESRKSVMDSMNKILGTFVQKIDHTSGGKPLPAAQAAVINVTVGGKAT